MSSNRKDSVDTEAQLGTTTTTARPRRHATSGLSRSCKPRYRSSSRPRHTPPQAPHFFSTPSVIHIDPYTRPMLTSRRSPRSTTKGTPVTPAMMTDPLTPLADAGSPDADRAGTDASTRLPERIVRFLLLAAFLLREYWCAFRQYRTGTLPSWWYYRDDLPSGSVQQLAASIRGEFGNAIAWMCLRRGIGPGHPNWPEIRCAIIAFGGSLKRFRPGLPAYGLQWWENPHVLPDAIGDLPSTPASDALAVLLSRQERHAPSAAPHAAGTAMARHARHAQRPASQHHPTNPWRHHSTGPPTGPPSEPDHQLCDA